MFFHHGQANTEEFIITCQFHISQFQYGKLLNTLRSKGMPSLQLLNKNGNAFHVAEIILISSFILSRPVTVTFIIFGLSNTYKAVFKINSTAEQNWLELAIIQGLTATTTQSKLWNTPIFKCPSLKK